MKTYTFSLMITSPAVDDETAADRLYEGGCDDALFSVSGGIYEIDFDREATTLEEAVQSAISDVNKAEIGARVVRVMPDDLVNANSIAERAGKTRQAVRLWIRGERGKGFPSPTAKVGESPVWSWAKVAEWLRMRGEIEESVVEDAVELAKINRVLELESQPPGRHADDVRGPEDGHQADSR